MAFDPLSAIGLGGGLISGIAGLFKSNPYTAGSGIARGEVTASKGQDVQNMAGFKTKAQQRAWDMFFRRYTNPFQDGSQIPGYGYKTRLAEQEPVTNDHLAQVLAQLIANRKARMAQTNTSYESIPVGIAKNMYGQG